MVADSQSGSGSGAGSGSGSPSDGTGGNFGGGPHGAGAEAPPPGEPGPIYLPDDSPITPPDQSLADRVAANLAQFGPLVSPLSDTTGGTETVVVPQRPDSSTNWGKTLFLLAGIGGGIYAIYYVWKHRKGLAK